jgi:hypothetical protein
VQLDERTSEGTYLCFLSHYKKEADAEATYIKEFLVEKTGRAIFLDSDSLRQVSAAAMKENIRKSAVVVLLQTPTTCCGRTVCSSSSMPSSSRNRWLASRLKTSTALMTSERGILAPVGSRGRTPTRGGRGARQGRGRRGGSHPDPSAVIPNVMSVPFNRKWPERLRHGALEDVLERLGNPEGHHELIPAASIAFAEARSPVRKRLGR